MGRDELQHRLRYLIGRVAASIARQPFQRLIVRDPEEPTSQISARASLLDVLHERKERFLNDLLAVGNRESKRENITQKTMMQFVK